MKSQETGWLNREQIIQIGGLLVAAILTQIIYSTVIRPRARVVEEANQAAAEADSESGYVPERSIFIILRDEEQQVCFTLLLWAMIMIGYKLRQVGLERRLLDHEFLHLETGERIIPQEALVHAKHIESELSIDPARSIRFLPRLILASLRRLQATESIREVSVSVQELAESESERMDSDLSLIRYIAWAIPSVGFIGTVRGIGEALSQADQAIKGNIHGVTSSLGLAFNSTLVALLLSIVLMYLIHWLQSQEEHLILDVKDYCRENLIALMKIPLSVASSAGGTSR